jgi:hypothetical protein
VKRQVGVEKARAMDFSWKSHKLLIAVWGKSDRKNYCAKSYISAVIRS